MFSKVRQYVAEIRLRRLIERYPGLLALIDLGVMLWSLFAAIWPLLRAFWSRLSGGL